MKRGSSLFMLAVLVFCAWQSRDLLDAWRHAPFDRLDPLAFAIWASPLALAWNRTRACSAVNPTLLLVAAAISLLGAITDMNVWRHVALAAACGSCLAANNAFAPWLLSAVAWMPVFGWFGSGLGVHGVIAARLAMVAGAAAWSCRLLGPNSGIAIA